MRREKKINGLKKMLKVLKSREFGITQYADGLCLILWRDKESFDLEFRNYIYKILPRRRFGTFHNYSWEPGAKAPRIEWINKQIEKLEKVK